MLNTTNVTDMVHNRTNRQNIRNPTFFCRIIRLATNNASRRREQHKALSDSLAFEIAPIQRLLNGQIVAPRRGANSRCKGCIVGFKACWLAYAIYWQVCVAIVRCPTID